MTRKNAQALAEALGGTVIPGPAGRAYAVRLVRPDGSVVEVEETGACVWRSLADAERGLGRDVVAIGDWESHSGLPEGGASAAWGSLYWAHALAKLIGGEPIGLGGRWVVEFTRPDGRIVVVP